MGSFFRIILLIFLMGGISISHAQAKTATSILLFGDSIIAGYGLAEQDSLSVQLEKFFHEKGRDIKVINGGVSGDTTSGGKNRLEWTVQKYQPDIIFIALGGNDMLRGLPPENSRKNLDEMLLLLKAKKIPVILSQVQAPANLGVEYVENFNKIYPALSQKYNAPLYPFILKGIFGKQNLMQSDGIHPNAQGVQVITNDLGNYLLKKLPKK